MKPLLLALQFLTVIRVRDSNSVEFKAEDYSKSLRWFFVIGLLIGAVQWSIAVLASRFQFPAELTAAFIVIVNLLMTGGLHLDGLADVADGFGAGHNREQILQIMKDRRLGVYGVSAIALGLYLKILATRFVLISGNMELLIVAPVVSRMSLACACSLLQYAREEGTGKLFGNRNPARNCFPSLILTTLLSFWILRSRAIAALVISVLSTGIFLIYVKHKINGFTGDTLGFQNELVEIAVLLCVKV